MSIPELFLPVTKMQIQEVRQKIINTTNIFQSLIIQGAAQFILVKIVSNNCNFRNGHFSSNNNTSKWIFIAIHVYAIQITKTLVTINITLTVNI